MRGDRARASGNTPKLHGSWSNYQSTSRINQHAISFDAAARDTLIMRIVIPILLVVFQLLVLPVMADVVPDNTRIPRHAGKPGGQTVVYKTVEGSPSKLG